MKLRALMALALAVLGVAIVRPVASASAYPATTCPTLGVSTTTPAPGESITVTGSDFDAHTSVTLLLDRSSTVLGTAHTDGTGSFTTHVTMPDGVTGNHLIEAKGAQTQCPADPVQIFPGHAATGPGAPDTGGPGTAFTGLDIVGLLLLAAALLGTGAAVHRRGSRSRRRAAARWQ